MSSAPRTLITLREFRRRRGGIGRTTDWRQRQNDPDYPMVVQISPGVLGVYEDEASHYIESRPRVAPVEPKAAGAARRRQLERA
jgi:hypothetical protein